MIATLDPLKPQFMYDAKRKVGTGRGKDADGKEWVLEFHDRDDEDRMTVVVIGPGGVEVRAVVTEDDFTFSDNAVRLSAVPQMRVFMHPVYLRKMRGFTRGNVPTPDIAGESLP
jgi:hypothetical protein